MISAPNTSTARPAPTSSKRASVKEMIEFWDDIRKTPKTDTDSTSFSRATTGRNTVVRPPIDTSADASKPSGPNQPVVTDAMEAEKAKKALALVKGTTPVNTSKVTLSEELAAFARSRAASRLTRTVTTPTVVPAKPEPVPVGTFTKAAEDACDPAEVSAPLQGWQGLKDAITGKTGLIAGFKAVVAGRTAEGFSNILRSIATVPVKGLAAILDGPRKIGDIASIKGKQLVVAGENQGGFIGALKSFGGGLLQLVGAVARLAKPIIGICLVLFGGPAGLIAGLVFLGLFGLKEAGSIANDKIDETQTLKAAREVVSGVGAMVGAIVSPLATLIKNKTTKAA